MLEVRSWCFERLVGIHVSVLPRAPPPCELAYRLRRLNPIDMDYTYRCPDTSALTFIDGVLEGRLANEVVLVRNRAPVVSWIQIGVPNHLQYRPDQSQTLLLQHTLSLIRLLISVSTPPSPSQPWSSYTFSPPVSFSSALVLQTPGWSRQEGMVLPLKKKECSTTVAPTMNLASHHGTWTTHACPSQHAPVWLRPFVAKHARKQEQIETRFWDNDLSCLPTFSCAQAGCPLLDTVPVDRHQLYLQVMLFEVGRHESCRNSWSHVGGDNRSWRSRTTPLLAPKSFPCNHNLTLCRLAQSQILPWPLPAPPRADRGMPEKINATTPIDHSYSMAKAPTPVRNATCPCKSSCVRSSMTFTLFSIQSLTVALRSLASSFLPTHPSQVWQPRFRRSNFSVKYLSTLCSTSDLLPCIPDLDDVPRCVRSSTWASPASTLPTPSGCPRWGMFGSNTSNLAIQAWRVQYFSHPQRWTQRDTGIT